ncbi:unnamed protein product [Coregonus sp. 'balchen']|nr:unnamed protein product [Coregonus sp. 'balchen']
MTGARQTNYSTRIDYIFTDHPLVKIGFVAADIRPEVEESDHCPVWGKLSCPLLPSCLSSVPATYQSSLADSRNSHASWSRWTNNNLRPAGTRISGGWGDPRPESTESRDKLWKEEDSKTLKAGPKPQGSLLAFFKPKPQPGKPQGVRVKGDRRGMK